MLTNFNTMRYAKWLKNIIPITLTVVYILLYHQLFIYQLLNKNCWMSDNIFAEQMVLDLTNDTLRYCILSYFKIQNKSHTLFENVSNFRQLCWTTNGQKIRYQPKYIKSINL